METVILSLAALAVRQPITAAIDSTGFGTRFLVRRIRVMKEVLEHAHVKLHALYGAKRLVFLMAVPSKELSMG
jgi:hypothetical protein